MGNKKLTKKMIDALPKATNPRGERYYDPFLKGFGIVVYSSGTKSFFVEYGPSNGRRRKTLGAYGPLTPSQARSQAEELIFGIRKGNDPLDEQTRERGKTTFRAWAEAYLKDLKARRLRIRPDNKRPISEDQRYLEWAWEAWGNKPIDKVTVDDVAKLFQSIIDRGKLTAANRFLASVRACMQAAWRAEKIRENPAARVKPLPENSPRSRVLTDEEFAKLCDAVNDKTVLPDPYTRVAFRLLIEIGARLSEVLRARWENLDLENMLWHLPSTKSGKPQIIPLVAGTVAMLDQLGRIGPYVIPGKDPEKPRYDLKRPWAKLQEVVGIQDVKIHDLRRTFGLQVAKTAGLHAASKLLRHSDIRVTEQVYAPLGVDDLRAALEAREKVIPLRRNKKPEKAKP